MCLFSTVLCIKLKTYKIKKIITENNRSGDQKLWWLVENEACSCQSLLVFCSIQLHITTIDISFVIHTQKTIEDYSLFSFTIKISVLLIIEKDKFNIVVSMIFVLTYSGLFMAVFFFLLNIAWKTLLFLLCFIGFLLFSSLSQFTTGSCRLVSRRETRITETKTVGKRLGGSGESESQERLKSQFVTKRLLIWFHDKSSAPWYNTWVCSTWWRIKMCIQMT
jgi:hypothetical protein